ncbi:MAG: glutaredoxin family protein [Vibrio sp.]
MIYLFSTQGCHLCEQAYALLESAGVEDRVETVDIAFDDALFARYGTRIPVIKPCQSNSLDDSDELGWPFQLNELQHWLGQHGFINHT